MLANEADLRNVISTELAPLGFKKKGNDWYLVNDDCIRMVNLQKSDYGGQYYINLGILLRDLSEERTPKEYQCHIRARLNTFAPAVDQVLDLDNHTIPDTKKLDDLTRVMRNNTVTFFRQMATLESIRAALVNDSYPGLMIMLSAKKLLGV